MDDYTIVNYIVSAVLISLTLYLIHRRDKNSIIELEDSVSIRGTTLSRIFNWGAKSVMKKDVVKIQLAGSYVTLFNKSNNAYDIFPRSESAIDIFNQAKSIFPNADVLIID